MRFFKRRKRPLASDPLDRFGEVGANMQGVRDFLKIEPRRAAAALVATRQKSGNRKVETDLLAALDEMARLGAALIDLANQSRPVIETYIATADDIERVLAE